MAYTRAQSSKGTPAQEWRERDRGLMSIIWHTRGLKVHKGLLARSGGIQREIKGQCEFYVLQGEKDRRRTPTVNVNFMAYRRAQTSKGTPGQEWRVR